MREGGAGSLVVRRSSGGRPVFARLSHPDPFQILLAEHERLRRQLGRTIAISGRGRTQDISPVVDALVVSVGRHLRREDLVLYPLCEDLFDGRDGVASVMRADHSAISGDLRSLARARGDPHCRAILAQLLGDLEPHLLKEERVLFPLMAVLVPAREATTLARRLGTTTDEHTAGRRDM